MRRSARPVTCASVALVAVSLAVIGGRAAAELGSPRSAGPGEILISVPGIPGPYCAYGAEKRLLENPAIAAVETDWDREIIRVTVADGRTVTAEEVRQAMERSEYPYEYGIDGGVEP